MGLRTPPPTLAASLGLRPRSAASVFPSCSNSFSNVLTPLRVTALGGGNYSTSLSPCSVKNFLCGGTSMRTERSLRVIAFGALATVLFEEGWAVVQIRK